LGLIKYNRLIRGKKLQIDLDIERNEKNIKNDSLDELRRAMSLVINEKNIANDVLQSCNAELEAFVSFLVTDVFSYEQSEKLAKFAADTAEKKRKAYFEGLISSFEELKNCALLGCDEDIDKHNDVLEKLFAKREEVIAAAERLKALGLDNESRHYIDITTISLEERQRLKPDDVTDFESIEIGSSVNFGSYVGQLEAELKPIKWQVLDIQDGKALLLAERAIGCRRFNEVFENISWEDCSLRRGLNEEFIHRAFSKKEQDLIVFTDVSADSNPYFSANPGNSTKDKIFLLSIAEAEKYFTDDELRRCSPTEHAKEYGADTSRYLTQNGEASCCWWLRSPGRNPSFAASVSIHGAVHYAGHRVTSGNDCVRPALWVKLEA